MHEEDGGRYLTPRTRAREVEPVPFRFMLRHPTGDGKSPRPMTPEERQYLRERKRKERLKQEAYLRHVTCASEHGQSTEKETPGVLDEAGDVVANTAAGVLGGWGASAVTDSADDSPQRAGEHPASPMRSDQAHCGTSARAAYMGCIAEERMPSWTDVLRHDDANRHGSRDDPSLIRDVSAALTAVVPAPLFAQAETNVLQVSMSPSKPVMFALKRTSPIRPPSIEGLGLQRGI